MLTQSVPSDIVALLDLRRDLPLLTPAERLGVLAEVEAGVERLLERLPAGTPEELVDGICELRYLAAKHLNGVPETATESADLKIL